jgi:hypothetical protein
MSAAKYLQWAQTGHKNGAPRLAERLAILLPRFKTDARAVRELNDAAIYRGVVAAGAAGGAQFAAAVLGIVERAAATEVENKYEPGRIDVDEIDFFNWVNLLSCCGYADHTHYLSGRLSRIETHPEHGPTSHYARGFAALALGVRSVYRPIAGLGVDDRLAFTRHELVGYNNQALLRHLAGAVEQRATLDDVRPAWSELVHRMDSEEKTGTLDGGCLFWVGRIVWHLIAGNALGSVADFVHRSFVDAAAEQAG